MEKQNQNLIHKELFIDDRFIEKMEGVSRRFHQAERHGDLPVLKADRPWEKDAAFVDSGLVIYDEAEKIFKAWYQGGACYGLEDKSLMCYAISSDGISWEKPELGLVELDGNKDNNIALLPSGMMHDPAPIIDHQDPDPERRFKVTWWGAKKDTSQESGWLKGHCVGFSPDGIHWTEHPDNPVWLGDAEVAVPFGIEHRTGKLTAFCSADGYGMRVVGVSTSVDFVNWGLPPRVLFQRDEMDPPGTEFGGLCGIDYDGTLIGLLWIIHNIKEPPFTSAEWKEIIERNIRQGFMGPPIQLNATGPRTIHTELVSSIDGEDWRRVYREPLIPFGSPGSWDECLSLGARPIVVGNRIYIYYTGHGRTEKFMDLGYTRDQIGQWNIDTGLATLRLDGFASLEDKSGRGYIITEAFTLDGPVVTVNAEAKGEIRLEAMDENGKSIDGFKSDQANPIVGDQFHAAATWVSKQDLRELVGRKIKIKLSLTDARLYSLSISKK